MGYRGFCEISLPTLLLKSASHSFLKERKYRRKYLRKADFAKAITHGYVQNEPCSLPPPIHQTRSPAPAAFCSKQFPNAVARTTAARLLRHAIPPFVQARKHDSDRKCRILGLRMPGTDAGRSRTGGISLTVCFLAAGERSDGMAEESDCVDARGRVWKLPRGRNPAGYSVLILGSIGAAH